MNRFHQYISDVQSGKVVTGRLIKLAVERHLCDLQRTGWEYYFDEAQAAKAIRFAEICCHWKGDKAKERIVLEPFQVFRRGLLYGWRDAAGGRRFRTSYYEVGRKNAKTTEAAIDALYHLMFEERKGAQVLCGATKEAQARIVVNDIGRIVQQTPELKDRFKVFYWQDEIKRVVFPERASYVAPLGKNSKTNDGYDPSQGIIDEYHEHPTDEILNVIESGMGSRSNPLINIITTAGFSKESPCFRLRNTGINILEGKLVNDRMLVIIYTMDEDDDWQDEVNWIKSNPNLNVSVYAPYLSDRFNKAMTQGGEKEVDFITKNLNRWMDAAKVWINDDKWVSCATPPPDFANMECYGGLDLAKYLDINAFALFFPDANYLKIWIWVPEAKLENQREANYRQWVKDGWIRSLPGEVIDHDFIHRDISDICKIYNVKCIAVDRYLINHTNITRLQDEGIQMLEHGQGFVSMHTPTITFEEMVLTDRLRHEGNPAMRWMLSNVVIDRDPAGNIKPTKGKSAGKIDGIVAGIMAIGASISVKKAIESVYANWDDEFEE